MRFRPPATRRLRRVSFISFEEIHIPVGCASLLLVTSWLVSGANGTMAFLLAPTRCERKRQDLDDHRRPSHSTAPPRKSLLKTMAIFSTAFSKKGSLEATASSLSVCSQAYFARSARSGWSVVKGCFRGPSCPLSDLSDLSRSHSHHKETKSTS